MAETRPKTLAELVRDFGRAGWTPTAQRDETQTVMVEDFTTPEGKRPAEFPTGNWIIGLTGPNGQYDEITVKPETQIPFRPGEQPDATYTPVRGPKEELKAPSESSEQANPALAAQRTAEAEAARALAASRTAEQAQKDRNKQATGFGLTDAELARLQSDAASQNLTAQQIAQRAAEMEQTGALRTRELDISEANNKIAAANQALAAKRQELDEIVRADSSKLDWAKFEYLKAKDSTDAQIAQGRLDLERLAQAQRTTLDQATLQQRKDEAALRAQEAAVTQQTAAQQAATTAASTILSSERQAQTQGATAGAGLLNQRVQAAQGMLQSVLGLAGQGQRSGNMGGGLMSAPAGLGEALVGGIQGWTTELGGGQDVYSTAARLVQQADPNNGQSPMAQAAYGVLGQMLEKYKQSTGQDHPSVLATNAAAQSAQQGNFVAPGVSQQPPPATSYPGLKPYAPMPGPMTAPQQGMAAIMPEAAASFVSPPAAVEPPHKTVVINT